MGFGRRNRPLSVLEGASAATDLDLISFLKAIPVGEAFSAGVARMRRGICRRCYRTKGSHLGPGDVFRQLQEQGADFLLTVKAN
jgi:hypothetical protein